MKKKLLAIFMAVAVIFTSASIGVFAAGEDTVGNVTGVKTWSGYKSITVTWNPVKGAQGYIISWQGYEGKTLKVKGSKTISNGSQKRYDIPVAQADLYKNYKIAVVAYKGKAKSAKPTIAYGQTVRTMQYKFTFKEPRVLHSYTGGNYTQRFIKGYNVIATGFSNGRYQFFHNNRMYYVNRLSTKNVGYHAWNLQKRYNFTEAELFVNRLNISSGTKRLIWVNTYSQKEYIFEGSNGRWKCVYGPWSVSTGSCYTPTSTGLGRIRQKDPSNSGLPYWSVVSYYSIHGKSRSWNLGAPASGGCVRNTNDRAKWIYYNCPRGTAVYVW